MQVGTVYRWAAAVLLLAAACAPPKAVLEAGKPAPELHVERLLGAPLGRLDGNAPLKGKPVVLEFWATWCGPCLAWLPHLNKLAGEYDGRVIFLSITDEPEGAIRRFLQKSPMAGWVGLDPARAALDAYGVRARPTTVVLDPAGRVAAVTHPWAVDAALLDSLLAGKALAPGAAEATAAKAEAAWLGAAVGGAPQAVISLSSPPVKGATYHYGGPASRGWPDIASSDLLAEAYGVRSRYVVFESPAAKQRFDAVLHLPGADEAAAAAAFQAFLTARLRVRVRRVKRTVDGYTLRKAGPPGPGLRPVAPGEEESGSPMGPKSESYWSKNGDFHGIVWALETATGLPVVDKTGIKGKCSMDFKWERAKPGSLERALKERLGLSLTRGPVEVDGLDVRPL